MNCVLFNSIDFVVRLSTSARGPCLIRQHHLYYIFAGQLKYSVKWLNLLFKTTIWDAAANQNLRAPFVICEEVRHMLAGADLPLATFRVMLRLMPTWLIISLLLTCAARSLGICTHVKSVIVILKYYQPNLSKSPLPPCGHSGAICISERSLALSLSDAYSWGHCNLHKFIKFWCDLL